MNWEVFYFVCFLVGFLLSLLTFLAGNVHAPKGFHFHGAHGHGHGTHSSGSDPSWFNFGTITAFLAWFGGTGYLLTRYSSMWILFALLLSALSGIAGAAVVFWFVFKVLLSHERDLDPADYNLIGVLGHLSGALREGGTGEMIFSQEGFRRCAAVRNEEGKPLPKGAEVVVLRYEKGIAYVRPWDEMNNLSTSGRLTRGQSEPETAN